MLNSNTSNHLSQLNLAVSNHYLAHQTKPAIDSFIDHALSGITYQPDNALHFAASLGDQSQLQTLLDRGYDINATDIFGCTALHIAAAHQNLETIQFLIDHGADVNPVSNYIGLPFCLTPLDFAVINLQEAPVVQHLLQQGAESHDWNTLNDILLTLMFESNNDEVTLYVLDILEVLVLNTPNVLFLTDNDQIAPTAALLQALCEMQNSDIVTQRTNQVIKLFFEHDDSQVNQSYLAAKNLLLCFPNDAQYEFSVGTLNHQIASEGHFGSYSAQFASNTLNQFILNYENVMDDPKAKDFQDYQLAAYHAVADAFNLGLATLLNFGAHSTGELFYEFYQQGQTFVMPTGWEQHAIDLVFIPEHNLYAVANAGMMYYGFTPGFNAYHPYYEITPETFAELSTNTSEFNLEFSLYYDIGLTHAPDFSFATEPQYMGNCSWYSQMVAEQGLLFVEALNITGDYSQALELSELWFTPLVEYQKTVALQEYLELPSLEFSALGDILVDYHQDFTSNPYSEQRIHLMMQHIAEHNLISELESYCESHPVSESLSDFVQTIFPDVKLATDDAWLEFIQPKTSPQALELQDVISTHDAPALWDDHPPLAISHETADVFEPNVIVYQPMVVEDHNTIVI